MFLDCMKNEPRNIYSISNLISGQKTCVILSARHWANTQSPFLLPPQSIIFQVESHPQHPSFKQCVTFAFFNGLPLEQMIYTIFCISFLYFLPLTIIMIAYTRIIIEISKKSKETQCEFSFIACKGFLYSNYRETLIESNHIVCKNGSWPRG